jgi:hypothetical protein
MPKSKSEKSKSTTKPQKKTEVEPEQPGEEIASTTVQSTRGEPTEPPDSKKSASAKSYKTSKPTGLTHKQKAGLARQLMMCAGDLMDVPDGKFNDEDLLGIDPKLKGEQIAAWVSYLPGTYWDNRLPQPSRPRGRRKI